MKTKTIRTFLTATIAGTVALSGAALAGHNRTYDVTITNLTRAQSFTPVLVVSHRSNSHLLFNAGEPASEELAALAEGGDTNPLNKLLDETHGVSNTTTSEGLLDPGKSVTIKIKVRSRRDRLSMAAMLIPTNDAFFSFQNLYLPRGHRSVVKYSPAYDAGSEPNDELCVNIPGPVCGGEGGSPGVSGEGYVHINGGIHGIGDLTPATYDWRNPVARVVIKRTR
jgi:hypothetical protein